MGHEVQCLGVLEALGIDPVIKRITPGSLFRAIAPWGLSPPNETNAPPWPDVPVVPCRQATPYARMISPFS